jgi:hypothetical protein
LICGLYDLDLSGHNDLPLLGLHYLANNETASRDLRVRPRHCVAPGVRAVGVLLGGQRDGAASDPQDADEHPEDAEANSHVESLYNARLNCAIAGRKEVRAIFLHLAIVHALIVFIFLVAQMSRRGRERNRERKSGDKLQKRIK